MKRLLIILALTALACGGLNTPLPSTPTVAPATETFPPPITDTPLSFTPTIAPSIEPPTNATTFPDPSVYAWKQVVNSGLLRPVDIQSAHDGSGRLFILEKAGRIRILQNGQLLETPYLNIQDRVGSRGNEQGLLGLVFHPNYKANGRFFVNYTDKNGNTVIARYQVSSDPNISESASEIVLLHIDQPFPNHNGGSLAFGPDGYLYAGLGDGGSGGDPYGNAQNLSKLLGKILRLDVDGGDPYKIPPDNPFGKVWAYGLRNPWRISFDKATGDLYIGDVGQDLWEEVDYLPAGSSSAANFGWNLREGFHTYAGDPPPGAIDPVVEYSHDQGCSVTGGYVYRGSMPEWNGIYLYADYCSGKISGLIHSENGWQSQVLFDTGMRITSFGQDENGDLYFASDSGGIYLFSHQ